MRTYYLLSYRPANQTFDGKFRQVRVELRVPQLTVRARTGYYAIPAGFELLSPEEYQVVAQWAAAEPANRMPLFLRAGAFRQAGPRPEYRVPVILEIPTAAVRFEKRGDMNQAQFQVLGLVRDAHNNLMMRFGGPTQFKSTSAEYDVLKAGDISFLESLQLPALRPYSVEVSLLQGERRVNLNIPPYRLSQPVTEPIPHVTVARFVQLAGLSPGNYALAINVRDALAGRTQSAHASFTVVN